MYAFCSVQSSQTKIKPKRHDFTFALLFQCTITKSSNFSISSFLLQILFKSKQTISSSFLCFCDDASSGWTSQREFVYVCAQPSVTVWLGVFFLSLFLLYVNVDRHYVRQFYWRWCVAAITAALEVFRNVISFFITFMKGNWNDANGEKVCVCVRKRGRKRKKEDDNK